MSKLPPEVEQLPNEKQHPPKEPQKGPPPRSGSDRTDHEVVPELNTVAKIQPSKDRKG